MVQKFEDLVKRAYNLSNEFYEDNPKNLPNPYYIGFGNPEADILILGKEQAYNQEHYTQLFFESINNPTEWFEKVENKICFNTKVYKKMNKIMSIVLGLICGDLNKQDILGINMRNCLKRFIIQNSKVVASWKNLLLVRLIISQGKQVKIENMNTKKEFKKY